MKYILTAIAFMCAINLNSPAFATDKTVNAKVHYKVDNQEGIRKTYYENGQLKEEANYKNGKLDGEAKYYYKNGQLKEEANYKNGKLDGEAKTYYINGKIQNISQYSNGTLIDFQDFSQYETR